MIVYTELMMDTQREAYAEAIAPLPADEKFALMLGAMVGAEDMAQLLDTVDYENDMLDRSDWARGEW